MKIRIISGLTLVAIGIGLAAPGGYFTWFMSAGIAFIALFELYRCLKIEKTPLGITGFGFLAIYYFYLLPGIQERVADGRIPVHLDLMTYLIMFFMALCIIMSFRYPKHSFSDAAAAFFGLIYAGILISFIYLLRQEKGGLYFIWLSIMAASVCDSGAYFVGKALGKHKMAPVLSPKKTIEGAVGGVIITGLSTIIYDLIFFNQLEMNLTRGIWIAAITMIASLFSMVGDLTASAIKRMYDIKDYGKIIPGHGGFMDRFDSMFFTAPIVYFLIHLSLDLGIFNF